MAGEAGLVVLPALYVGIIIGIYEALVLHRDVRVPTHRFGHTLHAFLFAIGATFAAMNVEFMLATFSFLQGIPLLQNPIFFRAAIGIIAMIKIHAVSAAISGSVGSSVGMRERWSHSLIVGALIAASPYLWPLIEPLAAKYLPT